MRHPSPWSVIERLTCYADRSLCVNDACPCNFCDDLLVERVDGIERLFRLGFDEFAVDVESVLTHMNEVKRMSAGLEFLLLDDD